ncbi:septation protein SepH [Sinomonas terrae]|uniref:Septation protein SepH n=1 Tax=Sinomonas terrae TaxID=2908838 RepID=A0ABS9U1W6_9MICC|nr:septation protein SepH [Sinomonas terrae]MCH6470576.1 septation protein SepH [Sinomonas terrae]
MREQPQDNLQELRLVGVHDDGQHLLLSAASGELFRLRVDEALRRAVARPAPQRPAPSGDVNLSPRQIQAEIRAGATAESISESSGIPIDRIRRYESPVLAEREHISLLAQATEVGPPPPAHSAFAAEFGHGPARLGDVVAHRLGVHGVNPSSVEWDSWRRRDGLWTVVARFSLPEGAPAAIGEEPPAIWTFNPVRRSVANANRWAQQLSELEPLEGPTSPRRLSVVDRPFDVEAPEAARPETPLPERRDPESDLLDMLRARRGQRLGIDEDAEDALALLLTQGIPAAHPRPGETNERTEPERAPAGSEDRGQRERRGRGDERENEQRPRRLEPVRDSVAPFFPRLPREDDPSRPQEDPHLRLASGLSTSTCEVTIVPAPRTNEPSTNEPSSNEAGANVPSADGPVEDGPVEDGPETDESAAHATDHPSGGTEQAGGPERTESGKASETPSDETESIPEPARRASRSKRSSIPTWDEIVFGTKSE